MPRPKREPTLAAPGAGDTVYWRDRNNIPRPAIVLEIHQPANPDSLLNLYVLTVQRQWVESNVPRGVGPGLWERRD